VKEGRVPLNRQFFAAFLFGLAVTATLASCSKEQSALNAIREAHERGDYEETIVQCRHAIRHEVRSPDVYYYYGSALLALGRDFESFQRLREAVELDASVAGRASQLLIEYAGDAYGRGERKRAGDRLRVATELDPEADLGLYQYLAGDAYFAENRFADAARMYQGALAAESDTSLAEQALFNLSDCHAALGDSAAAIEALEQQIARFPKGELREQGNWKLCSLLYESARVELARGNYDTVVESLTLLLERTDNATLLQRARFLLGEAYERLGEYQNAYEQYRAIIDEDRGASGRIVERARARIDAFRESGLL